MFLISGRLNLGFILMLTDLIIRNFAIIDNLQVSFSAGFNVLTGETGAGKSIVIDAVNLLLGGRARGDVIRTGEDEAVVEAIFELDEHAPLQRQLEETGLEADGQLLVRRIVSRSGKNRVFINGSPVPLAQLRDLTHDLVHIYGQHEHQHLQRPEAHGQMLDAFALLHEELSSYRNAYGRCCALEDQLVALQQARSDRGRRLDLLRFQQQELATAELRPGEDEELEQERGLLMHAEKLISAAVAGYEQLYGGSNALCGVLAEMAGRLENLQQIDSGLGQLGERLRSHQYGLEDIAIELRDYRDRLEFEPQRLEQVEERLALLTGLKRKYAPDIPGLLDYLTEIGAELERLDTLEEQLQDTEEQLAVCRDELLNCGRRLSEQRSAAAEQLSGRVEQELRELAMPAAFFRVQLTPVAEPTADGLERVEFYLTANPGEAAQPLARVASGGELSRIMLALRRSVPDSDRVATLIFDEVDAGIGGEAATAVGEKIARLAGTPLQILCVTHLPQVAAYADHHYRVEKVASGGRTTTNLEQLDDAARVREMARMLGGARVGKQTLEHARELLAASRIAEY